MNIKVIGTGCEKCDRLYANVEEALKITGCTAEVEKNRRFNRNCKTGSYDIPVTDD